MPLEISFRFRFFAATELPYFQGVKTRAYSGVSRMLEALLKSALRGE
jgi:hypothetical protein